MIAAGYHGSHKDEAGHPIVLWDARTGKDLARLREHKSEVEAVVFSPDGKTLASAGYGKSIRLWDVPSRKQRARLQIAERGIFALAFSPDSRLLASAGMMDKTVCLWDAATGKVVHRLAGHQSWVYSVAFSSDGKTVASAGYKDAVRLWAASTGTELRRIAGVPEEVSSLAFLPGDKVLASGGRNSAVQLWDVATGKELPRFGKATCGRCAVSAHGKVLVSWNGQALRLWQFGTGKELLPLAGHRAAVRAAAFSSDGKTLQSAAVTSQHGLEWGAWDARSGRQLSQPTDLPEEGRLLAFSPDRKSLAAAGEQLRDATVRLWDVASGRKRSQLAHPSGVVAIAFSPDGKRLATAAGHSLIRDDGPCSIRLWDTATARQTLELRAHDSDVQALRFSPDGRWLAAALWDKTARLWSTSTGKEVRRLQGHENGLRTIVFSPSGKLLATASQDGTVRLWETATGGEVRKLPAWATALAFAPDGKTLASVNGLLWNNVEPDNVIRLWDVSTGQLLGKLSGHSGGVTLLLFSPDGGTLVSGSEDATLLAWNVAAALRKPPAGVAKLSAGELEARWNDLADSKASRAYAALWQLAAAPQQADSLLKRRLVPASGELSQRLARLIAALDSDTFADRESASKELAKMGPLAEPALRQALTHSSLEVRQRAQRLLQKVEGATLPAEHLRAVRAVEVLELIASAEAKQLLEALGRGDPAAPLTRHAKGALERLKAR
jgi:WD40 repeat protein